MEQLGKLIGQLPSLVCRIICRPVFEPPSGLDYSRLVGNNYSSGSFRESIDFSSSYSMVYHLVHLLLVLRPPKESIGRDSFVTPHQTLQGLGYFYSRKSSSTRLWHTCLNIANLTYICQMRLTVAQCPQKDKYYVNKNYQIHCYQKGTNTQVP